MIISPKYSSSDWKKLTISNSYSDDWVVAAKIVEDRISGRYLKQIEVLESHSSREIWVYSGFFIMSIDCLVIETLNQFYLGIKSTNEVYNRNNKKSFVDFFQGSNFFRSHFSVKASERFYKDFRNGLLHEAQTNGGSLINVKKNEMVNWIDNNDITKGLEINRLLFHQALISEFNKYILDLKTNLPQYDKLRENCIEKMRIICLL